MGSRLVAENGVRRDSTESFARGRRSRRDCGASFWSDVSRDSCSRRRHHELRVVQRVVHATRRAFFRSRARLHSRIANPIFRSSRRLEARSHVSPHGRKGASRRSRERHCASLGRPGSRRSRERARRAGSRRSWSRRSWNVHPIENENGIEFPPIPNPNRKKTLWNRETRLFIGKENCSLTDYQIHKHEKKRKGKEKEMELQALFPFEKMKKRENEKTRKRKKKYGIICHV